MPEPSPPAPPSRITAEEGELVARLRSTLGRLEAGLATISDALAITDRHGRLMWCNQAFEQLAGRPRLLLLDRAITSLLPRDAEGQPLLNLAQLDGQTTEGRNLRAVLRHEPLRAVAIEWKPVLSDPEWPLVFCVRDISADLTSEAMRQEVLRIAAERRQLEKKVLACAVTGLPNRLALEQRLALAFGQLRDHPGLLTLLFCDLNGFKQVNDEHGHAAGDALLVTIGERLQSCLRASDLVSRLGGDEFVVLSQGPASPQEAMTLALRLLEEVGRPWSLEDRILHPAMSVGIAMTDDPDLGGAELIRRADVAMYEAKGGGGLPVALHDSSLDLRSRSREQLATWLQRTLADESPEREGLTLHFRPIIDLGDGSLHGLEATLALEPPGGALQRGAEALAVVERLGLAVSLGRWSRTMALARLQQGPAAAGSSAVAFQISPGELKEGGLSAELERQANRVGLNPARIALLLSEEVLSDPPAAVAMELEALWAMGVRLVLDGFGAGSIHLGGLVRLPLAMVRLHPSLCCDPGDNVHQRRLRQAALRLALDLDLEVIAEGIETEDQLQELRSLGCRWGQGPRFGPPLP